MEVEQLEVTTEADEENINEEAHNNEKIRWKLQPEIYRNRG